MSSTIQPSATVFVVDDDEELRDSLATLLHVLGFIVRTFSGAGSFERFYRPDMPGCLVLDIRMPRQSGIELYEQLLRDGKRLPVIFITAHADISTAVAAMKTGAIEFLEKPFDRELLVERVHRALELDAQWRASETRFSDLAQRVARLSDREQETLAMIHEGASNKSMAARLLLTERAVEMRRAAIMRKLQVGSIAELMEVTVTHRILAELRQAADTRQLPQA
jgi:FixJ family two-component response regulator